MDWSNDMVLEFLHYYEKESIIWDPKSENHTKKHLVLEAWRRIKDKLSWECSIEEMKKKKNSLMAYYRIHLNRMKNCKSGLETDVEYSTNWFAFDAMHRFLNKNYEFKRSFKNEAMNETTMGSYLSTEDYDSDSSEPSTSHESKPKLTGLLLAKEKMEKSLNSIQEKFKLQKHNDECDLYGKLLSEKLKKLDDENRLILMNEIDNLVFHSQMNARAVTVLSTSNAWSPKRNYQTVSSNFYIQSNSPTSHDKYNSPQKKIKKITNKLQREEDLVIKTDDTAEDDD